MTRYLTFTDVLDNLVDFAQAHGAAPQTAMRRAVLEAYDEAMQSWEWSFLAANGRVIGHAAQNDGTVGYVHSTRRLTLSGATWPTWAGSASVHLDGLTCDVSSRDSATQLTLDSVRNPGADIASGASYLVFERYLALPEDLLSTEEPMADVFRQFGVERPLGELEALHRYSSFTGDLRYFAVGPNPRADGLALFLYPALSAQQAVDFHYRRRRRDIRLTGMETAELAGTVAVSGTAVTGTTTQANALWAGAVMRTSATSAKPTGLDGANPYREERRIETVTSSTAWTLAAAGTTATGVGFRVADPLDMGRHCWDYLMRLAELRIARRGTKFLEAIKRAADEAFLKARAADQVSTQRSAAGASRRRGFIRLRDLA